jgi:hypothetical protein
MCQGLTKQVAVLQDSCHKHALFGKAHMQSYVYCACCVFTTMLLAVRLAMSWGCHGEPAAAVQ